MKDKQKVDKGKKKVVRRIRKIEMTDDTLTGRGGLALVLRYIERTKFYRLITDRFGFLRRSSKGQAMVSVFKQLLAFVIDGTYQSVSSFDRLRKDRGYAALLELSESGLLGSDQVKRFFRKFGAGSGFLFRRIMHRLFVWRLKVEQPDVVKLYMDTMVLNNDDARVREGVEPTYKRKKGFQPLQVSWNGYLVDAVFRSGSCHSNHGYDAQRVIKELVDLIRGSYRVTVPIIVQTDAGFISEENLEYYERNLGIHYICSGRLYDYIGVEDIPSIRERTVFEGHGNRWEYYDFGHRLKSWKRFRRAIYTSLVYEGKQAVLPFARTESIIYTNLGCVPKLDARLEMAGYEDYVSAPGIIGLFHSQGAYELVHRGLKEFMVREQLPFKRFGMNMAYYYVLALGYFLTRSYQYDVTNEVVPASCYPNTLRRRLIDFAAKIVRKGGQVILKVSRNLMEAIKLSRIWERCNNPVPI